MRHRGAPGYGRRIMGTGNLLPDPVFSTGRLGEREWKTWKIASWELAIAPSGANLNAGEFHKSGHRGQCLAQASA
jgi:hypothetical protein